MAKKTLESALLRMEEIIRTIDDDKTTLDASIALYKEGVALSEFCREKLDSAKLEIKTIGEQ